MDWRRETYGPLKWGSHFYRKFSIKQLIAYFQTPQKIFKYYSIAFKDTRWFVELKMVISEQFKSLNLNPKKKMRKLCTNEVGGVKMNKNKKYHILEFEKTYFLYCSFFWLLLWVCISKMICKAWEGARLNNSKWRRTEKDLSKCSVIG